MMDGLFIEDDGMRICLKFALLFIIYAPVINGHHFE